MPSKKPVRRTVFPVMKRSWKRNARDTSQVSKTWEVSKPGRSSRPGRSGPAEVHIPEIFPVSFRCFSLAQTNRFAEIRGLQNIQSVSICCDADVLHPQYCWVYTLPIFL